MIAGGSIGVTSEEKFTITSPWSGTTNVHFPASTGVVFCFVAAGRCDFAIEGEPLRALEQGDFLLLSRPPRWHLARETDESRPTVVVDYVPRAGRPERARFVAMPPGRPKSRS